MRFLLHLCMSLYHYRGHKTKEQLQKSMFCSRTLYRKRVLLKSCQISWVLEGQCCISPSALVQGTEDCRITSFSSYAESLEGNTRMSSLETHTFWRTAGQEWGCVNTWPMTWSVWKRYTAAISWYSPHQCYPVTPWRRARSMEERISLRPFLGLVLGETVYISRVIFIYFYVLPLQLLTILKGTGKKITWRKLCSEVVYTEAQTLFFIPGYNGGKMRWKME